LATLDQFSKGRLIVSVGVGAYREEFNALLPDFNAHRGNLLEEGVQALQHLFTERNASWEGEYYHYQDVEMYPKPLQDPLPIYFGGNNVNATIRAAKHGQGWMPAGMPTDQIRERVNLLHEVARKEGRGNVNFDVAPQLICYVGKTYEEAVKRFEESQMYHHLISLKQSTLKEGMFCGISSGANVHVCLKLAEELGPGKRIVTVLPDSRDRYLEVEKYTT